MGLTQIPSSGRGGIRAWVTTSTPSLLPAPTTAAVHGAVLAPVGMPTPPPAQGSAMGVVVPVAEPCSLPVAMAEPSLLPAGSTPTHFLRAAVVAPLADRWVRHSKARRSSSSSSRASSTCSYPSPSSLGDLRSSSSSLASSYFDDGPQSLRSSSGEGTVTAMPVPPPTPAAPPAAPPTEPTSQLAAPPPLPADLAQMFDEPIGLGAAPTAPPAPSAASNVSSGSWLEKQQLARELEEPSGWESIEVSK